MEKVRVMYDKEGNTLDVWFEEPRAAIAEETGAEVILKKDPKTGREFIKMKPVRKAIINKAIFKQLSDRLISLLQ